MKELIIDSDSPSLKVQSAFDGLMVCSTVDISCYPTPAASKFCTTTGSCKTYRIMDGLAWEEAESTPTAPSFPRAATRQERLIRVGRVRCGDHE